MVGAIGEADLLDTAQDARLGRIFFNRTLKMYRAFDGFFGMEDTIERIVGYFKHAAQGLEEKRQILYLLGPVGGGKSSLAERLKDLMEKHPIYVLKAGDEIMPGPRIAARPVPLRRPGGTAAERYGIEQHRLTGVMSPWAVKRLDQFGGDISKFEVARIYPSKLRQVAIAKTEPGDENNQDISSLVGKVDIRKLEHFSQNDPDAYSFSGGLCRANQGLLEFVEMFKAPIKVLHPLLTATQEGNYIGTETLGPIPFSRHHSRPFQRSGMAGFQGEQEQRSLPRPHLRRHRSLLPARDGRDRDLPQAPFGKRSGRIALRARDARDAGQVLRHDAAEGA